jgi:hypothetical protein
MIVRKSSETMTVRPLQQIVVGIEHMSLILIALAVEGADENAVEALPISLFL